jgi:hypothetical protein
MSSEIWRYCASMLSASLISAGSSIRAWAIRASSAALSVPRARPAAIAVASSTVSCVVKALVEATPISGPARVGSTACDSRAIALSGTLTTDRRVWPLALA